MEKLKKNIGLTHIIIITTITLVFIAFMSWVILGNRSNSKTPPVEVRDFINTE